MRYPGLRHGAPVLLALLGSLAAPAAFACNASSNDSARRRADESGLSVSAGASDYGRDHAAAEVGIEHRFRSDWCLGLGPHVGVSVTSDESFYVYAGTDRRIDLGRFWFLDASFATGFYEAGGGKDIGGALEFRSGFVVGRRLRNGSQVGLGFGHLSNSAYYRFNPGVNSLFLRWSKVK